MERTIGSFRSEFVRVEVGPDMAGVLVERIAEGDFDLLYQLAGKNRPTARQTPEDLQREAVLHSGNLGAFNAWHGGILADGNVAIDTRCGWVEMRFPSGLHERVRSGMGLIFSMLGRQESGFRLAPRFRQDMAFPDAPEHSALVASLSYYAGETVGRWSANAGSEAMDVFERSTPPDLVVEVERSGGSGDAARMETCRRLGVAEMWRLDTPERGWTLTMTDLQAPGGPRLLEDGSAVLPGMTAAFVLNALRPAMSGLHREVVTAIEEYGVGMPTEEEAGFSL